MKRFNTVLFDFDGTLMDTNGLILQSWQHTLRTVEGKERPREEIFSSFGEPLSVTMKKFLPQIPVEEGVEIYRSYHYDNFTGLIEVFPGILELLRELRARGYKTGIVTSRLRHTTDLGLRKYDMEQYFDAVITVEDTVKPKPDPEPVRVALERLGSAPEEAIMIGDSVFDVQCARRAGVKAAIVGWAVAFGSEERAGANAPDYFLEKPGDLLEIL
jgi:pyrophosphatase PpaX